MYEGPCGACTDDAGIVCKSRRGFTKMFTVVVTVLETTALTVSKKTESMLLQTPHEALMTWPFVMEAAHDRCR